MTNTERFTLNIMIELINDRIEDLEETYRNGGVTLQEFYDTRAVRIQELLSHYGYTKQQSN